MKPFLFAFFAIILYAVQNALIDEKLRRYSTASLLVGFYLVMLPLGGLFLGYMKATGKPIEVPVGNHLWILIAVAVMFFLADLLYLGAYTNGGNAIMITILVVLVPVLVALIKFVWFKYTPTNYHIASFFFALLSIVFIAIGNNKKEKEQKTNDSPQIQTANP
jgi:drug/metabolite transporter (DMT)-like permease